MPQCFCTSNNCNGQTLNQRAYAKHQREDKARLVDDALSRAQKACQEQDDAIAAYIGSLTLSDEATAGVEDFAGGRIWSRSETFIPRSEGPSYHRPITDTLNVLCKIEHELSTLVLASSPILASLRKPSAIGESFPLKDAMAEARRMQDRLAAISSRAASVLETKRQISDSLTSFLAELKMSHSKWAEGLKNLQDTPTAFPTYKNDHHHRAILSGVNTVVQACIFTMVALQVIVRTSRRGCHFLLEMMHYVVQLVLMRHNTTLSDSDRSLLASFPKDPESTLKNFGLESEEKIYAVCPNAKCHKTYDPTFSGKSPVPTYPMFCSHRRYSNKGACGTRLTRPSMFGKKVVEVPIKRFVSFSFKDYVGGLLSRPGFEDVMDSQKEGCDGVMSDVSDGEFLKNFKGPDNLAFKSTGLEGRYAFSLCVDFFNPFTNKQAGKKYSVGIISMACLNLPSDIRYKPENMFLAGIIPGPNEPPTDTINHYLRPLVDDLAVFWNPGIWYTRTYNHAEGRLIRCALVLVVCDLPAARKTAGFAAANHEHFCSLCHCTRSEHGYNNIDTQTWVGRTDAECRAEANLYLTASDEAAQTEQFNKTGIRWSELSRLPYFDMVRCVIVDSMHNLFLGLIKEHFTAILGIGRKPSVEKPVISLKLGVVPHSCPDSVAKAVEKIRTWLAEPVAIRFPSRELGIKRLMRFNLQSLAFICTEFSISPSDPKPTKEVLANRILDWRLRQNEEREVGADSATKLGSVVSVNELSQLWQDIEQLLTPSWVASVPTKLGSAAHGKLKADQWRVLGTIYLPIAFIHLWSATRPVEDQVRSIRCRAILDVTMSLVSAIIAATSRSVTRANGTEYHHHMLEYLRGIKELFPEYRLHPNHHMALHLDHFLYHFGPLNGWWTFPFERMIGAIQRMPHNGKAGELEESIARAYMRSANFRALALKPGCPEVICHAQSIFKRFANPQIGYPHEAIGQLYNSISDIDDDRWPETEVQEAEHLEHLPADIQHAFKRSQVHISPQGRLLYNISMEGVTYSPYTKHRGNSCVLVTENLAHVSNRVVNGRMPAPAQITHLIETPSAKGPLTYVVVRRFKEAGMAVQHDPFVAYPLLRTKIWAAELEDMEECPI